MNISKDQFFKMFGTGEAPNIDRPEFTSPMDRRIIMALCRVFRPSAFLEMGVQAGITAQLLLDNCPWIERYHGVDLPPGGRTVLPHQQDQVPRIAGELVLGNPKFHMSTEPPQKIYGMAFIDGDHSFDGVMRDSEFCLKWVDGVIVWHDYTVEGGVNMAIDQMNKSGGDRIFLVDGTHTCFRLNRPPAGGILTH